jgi:hypothetical protein
MQLEKQDPLAPEVFPGRIDYITEEQNGLKGPNFDVDESLLS